MYSISRFSKLTRLSPRMLRHYDKIGLLKPETTDTMNNYRYYSDLQIATAMEIIKLKKYDFSLEEIKKIFNNDDMFLKKMIKDKIDIINKSITVKTDILEEMEIYLQEGIKSMTSETPYSILYGTVQEQYVIKKNCSISIDEIDTVIDEIYDYALQNKLFPVNTPAISFIGEDFNDDALDVEIFVPIRSKSFGKFDGIHKIQSHSIVSTIHIGNYESIGLAYQAIEKWLVESNITPTGFTYEIYFRSTESIVSENDYVTQVCYEVY